MAGHRPVPARHVHAGVPQPVLRGGGQDRWCDTIAAKSTADLDYFRDCTPSLLNGEGNLRDAGKLILTTAYGGGPFEYIEVLGDWRERAMTVDLELTR